MMLKAQGKKTVKVYVRAPQVLSKQYNKILACLHDILYWNALV